MLPHCYRELFEDELFENEKHELFCKIFVNSFKKVGQKPRKNDGFDCIFLTKSNNSEAFNGDWKSGGRCVGHKDK